MCGTRGVNYRAELWQAVVRFMDLRKAMCTCRCTCRPCARVCPGCQSAYIGKTADRTLFVRTHEHAISDKESTIYKHLRTCDHLIFIRNLCNLPDTLNTDIVPPPVSYDKEYFTQVVRDNTTILDYDNNWNLLLYKEAYFIKRLSPSLNNGLKSSRELHLFS